MRRVVKVGLLAVGAIAIGRSLIVAKRYYRSWGMQRIYKPNATVDHSSASLDDS